VDYFDGCCASVRFVGRSSDYFRDFGEYLRAYSDYFRVFSDFSGRSFGLGSVVRPDFSFYDHYHSCDVVVHSLV
jgi:hypothetical protein